MKLHRGWVDGWMNTFGLARENLEEAAAVGTTNACLDKRNKCNMDNDFLPPPPPPA